MPRSRAANRQLREVQRAKILDAARLIFSRGGPTATMDDIADAANVSHGLAYRYFPGKDAIIQALVDEALASGPASLQHFEQTAGTPEDRLVLLVSTLIDSRRKRPEFHWLLDHVQNSGSTTPKLRNKIRRQKVAFLGVLKRLITEAQARGAVHPGDPERLVMAISAVLVGLGRIALDEPERFSQRCPEPDVILRMLIRPRTEPEAKR